MPFNKLSPAEAERLAILAEEAGEIVQAVGKILRHGYESYNPEDPRPNPATGMGPFNRHTLARELGDLDAICGLMAEAGDIDIERIKSASRQKRTKLKRWTHHQDPTP
jgi:NTP pyrophosphatase (non-canonical NTP hydrolase)